jgi:hypothetical protein
MSEPQLGPNTIRFFKDKECMFPVENLTFEGITLAGTKKPIVLWAKNTSGFEMINIVIEPQDKDVVAEPASIIAMQPNLVTPVVFVFQPSIDRTEPLRNCSINVSCVIIKRA